MRYGESFNLGESVYIEALEALGFDVLADDGNKIIRPYDWETDADLPERAGPILARRRENRGMADVSESGMYPTPRKSSYVAPTLPEVWQKVVDDLRPDERARAVLAMNERVTILLGRVQAMTKLLGVVYGASG